MERTQLLRLSSMKSLGDEQNILALHDIVLTNGFHTLQFATVAQGRAIMEAVLASVPCFNTIAVISSDIGYGTYNLYANLVAHNCIDPITKKVDQENLTMFFVEQFHADFLWIELTPDLMMQPSFNDIQQKLYEFNCARYMPIVIMEYAGSLLR